MENQTKMQILERLVKDGSISLAEAFTLNEAEIKVVEAPIVSWPVTDPNPQPWNPFQPSIQPYTLGTTTDIKYPLTGTIRCNSVICANTTTNN